MAEEENLYAIIKAVLATRSPRHFTDQKSSRVHAAVLMPLFYENGEYKVLFIKRTDMVEKHKGQISFPGGGVDEEDGTPEQTALREAYEEIGLMGEDVEILGQIDDTPTVSSNYVIHPFVARIPQTYNFKINAYEVESLIEVPFRVFHPRNSQYKRNSIEINGVFYQTPAYVYGGDVIWGATARIMENFMEILAEKLPLPVG